jgi:ankyrin repeat protein
MSERLLKRLRSLRHARGGLIDPAMHHLVLTPGENPAAERSRHARHLQESLHARLYTGNAATPTRATWTGRAAHETMIAHGGRVSMSFASRSIQTVLLVAAGVLIGAAAVPPVHTAEAPTCRDHERRLDQIKTGGSSMQLSLLLFAAADLGCVPLARRLLEAGASLEARDRLGAMALARAARAGHLGLAELLLAQGAPIDARNLVGATALFAAAENERGATVALLLAKGAGPNLPGRAGVTPLSAAAFRGSGRIVEQLIARGADPDVVDATGKAAITYAAARGFAPIVHRLLDAGVDPKLAYGNELTALMWAAGHEDGVGAGAARDVVALLLDAGAAIDAVDNRGRSALMMAAELGHAELVELLVVRGADRTVSDRNGKRALDLAANDSVRAALVAR